MLNDKMDGICEKQYFHKIRDISKNHAYVNVPIPVMVSLRALDCVSRCIWMTVYELSYFQDGELTITMQHLAGELHISRSSLNTKINDLIDRGYLAKRNNYDSSQYCNIASTYFVRLPEEEFERIRQMPSRRESYDDMGRFVTEGFVESKEKRSAQTMATAKEEIQHKINELESLRSLSLAVRVEVLGLKSRLRALDEAHEKNFASELSTGTSFDERGVSKICTTYNNIKKIDIINNKTNLIERSNFSRKTTEGDKSCSLTTQNEKGMVKPLGYRHEPLAIPNKTIEKIKMTVHSMNNISNREQVIEEGLFAVSRCFTRNTVDHAANTFCKLLRQERWTTPIPLRMIR